MVSLPLLVIDSNSHKPGPYLYAQSFVAGVANFITIAIGGTLLLAIYASSRTQSGSPTKDQDELSGEWDCQFALIPPLFFSRNMDKYISFNQFTFQYDAQAEATLKISALILSRRKVLILGPSGSGKSTWLSVSMVSYLISIKGQAQGQVRIAGQNIFKQSIYDKSQLVSTVLQDPDGQFIGLTVAEDLALPWKMIVLIKVR